MEDLSKVSKFITMKEFLGKDKDELNSQKTSLITLIAIILLGWVAILSFKVSSLTNQVEVLQAQTLSISNWLGEVENTAEYSADGVVELETKAEELDSEVQNIKYDLNL